MGKSASIKKSRNNLETALVIAGSEVQNYLLDSLFKSVDLNLVASSVFDEHAKDPAPNKLAVAVFFLSSSAGLSSLGHLRQLNNRVFIIAQITERDDLQLCAAYDLGADMVFTGPLNLSALSRAVTRHMGSTRAMPSLIQRLTAREEEVFNLIISGQTTKETARDLGISDRTVEVHRGNVMDKLMARNVADLARIVWQERGLRAEEN